ncbi:titin homolog isoform X2 [Parambassis ranga]|uniref:non-specific serine/threonine protein kinase n=1 Tax=Parambassis ranga TaxID=210632 RepID=A0A6P7KEN9_9TELE|nr:titin homolog isoform X2 [Parambassis ranga]
MTSRRPMTRSFSGNGRTSSFSEEENGSSNGRSESRNTYLSNVRPENRSTLCTVMAQLTEDIQPSFDTTLKSKAVSEKCNVKFTCVVSGYPAPELKWYKDDMEMDRYCGLPKYEIRRNGKTHTLHIYNCTLDDAAIYQVSASNSKGIVSCSGVLEVGTMNEYKIHQRFFEKLKQKAEKKKKDLEGETKKGDKENIQKEKPQRSPEQLQRKRSVPPKEEKAMVKEPVAVEQQGNGAEANGISSGIKETAPLASMDSGLEEEVSPSEETLAKKRAKMSNGVDAGVNSSSSNKSHIMGNGGENCYDGGIRFAQFLAETLQSQATAEEIQNSFQTEKPKETDAVSVNTNKENERDQGRMQKKKEEQEKALQEECGKDKRKEEELAVEREKYNERHLEVLHTTTHGKCGSEVKHHGKGHKDPDHHNIQASISHVLHTVKDFFFGKSKKDSHDLTDSEEKQHDHSHASVQPHQPEMPPSFQLQTEPNPEVCHPATEEVVPMEMEEPKESSETVDTEPQPVSLEPHKFNYADTEQPAGEDNAPVTVAESTGPSVMDADGAGDAMEVSVFPESSIAIEDMSSSAPLVLTEAEEKHSAVVSIKENPINQQEIDSGVLSPQPSHRTASDEMKDKSALPHISAEEICSPTSTLTSMEDWWSPPPSVFSVSDNHNPDEAPNETLQEEQISVDTMCKEDKPSTAENHSYNTVCEGEKAEVKLNEEICLNRNRSEISELSTFSVEDKTEPCQGKTPDQVLLSLSAAAVSGSAENKHVEEEAKSALLTQEMNEGFPPTSVSESLEQGDLKMPHECTLSIAAEITDVQVVSATQSSNSGVTSCEEVPTAMLEKDLEQEGLEGESTEERNAGLQCEVKTEDRMHKEVLHESKVVSELQNNESNVNVLKEHTNIVNEDRSESVEPGGWPLQNIPQIQISSIEDISEIKPTKPDLNPDKPFIIPAIEVMKPEHKECTLPLTILTQSKPEPTDLQKHDTTHLFQIIIPDHSVADSPDLLPTLKSAQNDHLSPTEKVKEIAQFHDETEMLEHLKPHRESERLPQLDSSIPIISVSCTDDNAVESPKEPLLVEPPISVASHETDPEILPTHREGTETETSAGIQRGTKHDNSMTMKPEKTQDKQAEETTGNRIKENPPFVLYEATKIPKVGDGVQSSSKIVENTIVPEILKPKSLKDGKTEVSVSVEDLQKNRSSVDRLTSKPPAYPSLSPGTLRKFMSKATPDPDTEAGVSVPLITVGDHQTDKADEDLSGGSTPTSSLSCESSPRMKRRDSLTLIRSATPEELASGARRKIFIPKPKEDVEGAAETPYMSPSQARRAALLQASTGQNTPPMERRSPLLSRRKTTLEVPKVVEERPPEEPANTKQEEKPAEKKIDPLKAPQVIRKIRGEPFPDASGHLKLWCQFFNVLSDSTIKWYKDEEEILEVKRSGGDESQVALAVVLASSQDCGVYGCTITNEYGTDTTDFLLSIDILSEILLKDDLEIGEEIEMTPMLFNKGLADCGSWGEKYFGRIMTETVHIGEGCAHKASRVKVIYGLDPIFESGSTCIIKVKNPIPYGTKQESNLAERNHEITKQECKVQNMIREYCKIFAAEARVIENFGCSLEVIPRYLMYRPANSVPYTSVEADLTGVYSKYAMMDPKGKLITYTASELEQKCSSFQHWIHQWTHGNLLVTQLEGVESKLTNVKVVTKSKGYQGLTEHGSPEVFEQFLTHHQCNYYCGLLSLRPLKTTDSLQQPGKMKGSKSPLLNRKMGSNSPQLHRKGQSPQLSRKANSSPKMTRKGQETEDNKTGVKPKTPDTLDVLEMR